MKKINLIALTFVIAITGVLMIGCGKGEEYALDRVNVFIKGEYQQKFEAKEFATEDFAWDNLERFWYGPWYDDTSNQYGMITVHLTKHGKKQVSAAIEHFKTLDFVLKAEKQDYNFAKDTVSVLLKEEAVMDGKVYKVEDFPELALFSITTFTTNNKIIFLYLAEPSYKNVLAAVELLMQRNDIKWAGVSGYDKVA